MKKLFLLLILSYFFACTKDKYSTPDTSCYPEEVSKIIVNKCATSGCHNTQSAGNSNGLDYSTWKTMFKGGKNGSSVIPYSTDFSYMLYFCNTDTNLGIALEPTMPFQRDPLSTEEYLTLKNWIAEGAPNCEGYVNFSDNPNRKKFYVCMQPCNKVAVFDAETRVIMRYINVGNGHGGPHQLRITPDGKYWCLVFSNGGDILQIFRTDDDTEVGSITLDPGNYTLWNTVSFTSDSKYAFVSDLTGGKIARVDLTSMTSQIITQIPNAHGTAVTPDDSTLYVTDQLGSTLYKVHLLDDQNPWSVDPVNLGQQLNVHEIIFSPDGTKYFLSCEKTNEVRVYNASNDQMIAQISVGPIPQEFSISKDHKWLFVTCKEDSTSPGCSSAKKGSVYIIDYTTNSKVNFLYPGFQPHGIAVDDDHDVVYVANLNYDGGPAPHHVSECGGRNGYVSVIDMSTQQLLNVSLPDGSQYVYKNEVLQFPYFVAYRK
jgi:DNA-binding beta-propeller fold protein YncE